MARLKQQGESARTASTARAPPSPDRLAAFQVHFDRTVAFTDELRATRCRGTDHFTDRLGETVAVFAPLSGAHKAEVVFFLYMHGPQRFNALKRGLGGVSSRVLTDKLRELESQGFLARDSPSYALTPRGERVARLLHPLVFYLHNEPTLAQAHPSSGGEPLTGP